MAIFFKYWIPVIIYALLIFILSSIPGSDLPPDLILPDYILHFLEYLPFGLLVCRAIKKTKINLSFKMILSYSILAVILYAASDEIHQMFVPGRNISALDLFCDSIGALVGIKFVI